MGAGILTLIVLCVLLQTCSAVRDPNLTLLRVPGVVGVWNRSKYPASQFRDESVVTYFDFWPENNSDVKFMYFCEDPRLGNLSLSNFTYSPTENQLISRPYYDLGVVNSYQPYWHFWVSAWYWGSAWTEDMKRISYPINCEYHDLRKLYSYRFWRVPLLQGCVTFSMMQCAVLVVVLVITSVRRMIKIGGHLQLKKQDFKENWHRPWSRNLGDSISDYVHLWAVVEVGCCMLESIGHSPLRSWRARFMFNTAVIYTWLSLFAMLATIIRHVTIGWSLTMGTNIKTISDDWRWQRVFLQMATLVLTSTVLLSVDDASGAALDEMTALLLATALVACTWSLGVSAFSLFRFIGVFIDFTDPLPSREAQAQTPPSEVPLCEVIKTKLTDLESGMTSLKDLIEQRGPSIALECGH